MPLALATENKLVLGLTAAVFIVFALVSALVIPRSRPDFPGSGQGLRLFIAGTALLFVAMMTAMALFGEDEEEGHEAAIVAQVR